jgi:hypothetical protein
MMWVTTKLGSIITFWTNIVFHCYQNSPIFLRHKIQAAQDYSLPVLSVVNV